jgi:hypothetical protein
VANLLAERSGTDEAIAILRVWADAGDMYAAHRLADLLAAQRRVDEAIAILRVRAAAGDGTAAILLADLLARAKLRRVGERDPAGPG